MFVSVISPSLTSVEWWLDNRPHSNFSLIVHTIQSYYTLWPIFRGRDWLTFQRLWLVNRLRVAIDRSFQGCDWWTFQGLWLIDVWRVAIGRPFKSRDWSKFFFFLGMLVSLSTHHQHKRRAFVTTLLVSLLLFQYLKRTFIVTLRLATNPNITIFHP